MARYNVWVGDTPNTTYTKSRRLVPVNCRKQEKGLGAATFRVRSNIDTTIPSEFSDDNEEFELYQIIRVEDEEKPGSDQFERTIWCGYISDILKEPYVGSEDYVGTIVCGEIGVYYDELRFDPRFVYKSEDNRFLDNPPNFNPIIQGIYFGNKVVVDGTNRFKNIGIPSTASNFELSDVSPDNVWSVADIIELIASEYDFSWEYIAEEGGSSSNPNATRFIEYLHDKTTHRSFPNFQNKPLSKILETLLPKPLTWRFSYEASSISQGVVELVIESESDVDIQQIPASSNKLALTVPNTRQGVPHGVQKFNVNSVNRPVDQLIVKGKPILVTGSVTTWDANNQSSLEPGWTDNEQQAFVNGISEREVAAEAHEAYRKEFPNVYQKFDFKDVTGNNDVRVFRFPTPGSIVSGSSIFESNIGKKWSFFPLFKLTDDDGNYLTEPIPLYDTEADGGSQWYSTPNSLSIKFENELGIYNDLSYYLPGEGNIVASDRKRLKPMVWAPVRPDLQEEFFWTNLLQTTLETKSQLDYHPNGFYLRTTYPQYFAWNDTTGSIYTGEDEVVYDNQVEGEWSPAPPLATPPGRNPDEGEEVVKGLTHWSRFIFTFAARCDQDLSVVKRREELSGTDSQGNPFFAPAEVKRREIIETPYECWWVAKGTVFRSYAGEDGSFDLLERIQEDHFVRNDMPILVEFANNVFEWVSKERRSISLEYQMNNLDWSDGWTEYKTRINTFVTTATDRKLGSDSTANTWQINSAVKSVEWIFNETTPVVIISTEIPQEPAFSRLFNQRS